MKAVLKVIRAMKLLLNKKIKDSKGFTLIEVLLVAMLMFVVISMLSATYFLAINTSRGNIESATSGSDARIAALRITKDLREADSLETAEYNNIIFYSNIDTDVELEKVNYYLEVENGYYNLYRKIDYGQAKIIVTHIVNNKFNIPLFAYYEDINTPVASTPVVGSDLDRIKIIEIYIYIDQSGTGTQRTMKLETAVSLRNKIY
jgi:type II secretory pathway pseudopilin PulG